MNPTARAPSHDTTTIAREADLNSTLRIAAPANDQAPGAHHQAILRRVALAIQERRVCVLRYASEPVGSPSTRAIEPLAVVSARGTLGLLAWCRLRRDLRTFRVDRIAMIALAAEHFAEHPGLALERFIQRRRRTLP
jgi:predicted DNA-binding transcriptional regulator YafY